jgi:hypothetical protein
MTALPKKDHYTLEEYIGLESGANGDGAVTGFTAPKAWPDQLKQRWKIAAGAGHSSPLVVGARVYLHSRQGENAAMVIAGDTIFSLTNDADLIVTGAADKGAKVIRKYRVAEKPTWAHPAIVGRNILIKDETTLAMWSLE